MHKTSVIGKKMCYHARANINQQRRKHEQHACLVWLQNCLLLPHSVMQKKKKQNNMIMRYNRHFAHTMKNRMQTVNTRVNCGA